MADEFFFDNVDSALKRFPDELWVAKGKPKLWVKLYDSDGITVWRDLGYGLLKLRTPEGVAEGMGQVSVGGTLALLRDQRVEVYVRDSAQGISPEEDTLELDLEAELVLPEEGGGA
ncbi:MAG: hypothetical protein ACUVS3_06730 [Thermodesulfobacteriota bacterium]